jgi:hypothetical protein
MHLVRRFSLPLLLASLLLGLQLAGCAGAPVQEMSNARQAIRAAKAAGAEQHAPELYHEAQQLVEAARLNLGKREYRLARDQAEEARSKAIEARRVAEQATGKTP